MRKLFLIPARGGSKGLPGKNIMTLSGRSLIEYTLEAASANKTENDEICVSTDDLEIVKVVEKFGIKVPFIRPSNIATDHSSTADVIEHALAWYNSQGQGFDLVVLLQATSPLRNAIHIKMAISEWSSDIDMLISVRETDSNPYYVLFEEDEDGFLQKSKEGLFERRQDCPKVYEANGAIYIFGVETFRNNKTMQFNKLKKFVMSKENSVDIDDIYDFKMAEMILTRNIK